MYPSHLFPSRRRPLLWEELPTCSAPLSQELRHEEEQLELEAPAWVCLLRVWWSLEPLCKDLKERQGEPQAQQHESCVDLLRWEL